MSVKHEALTGHYTVAEEIANVVTHGLGLLLSLAGFVVLIVAAAQEGDPWKVVSFSIYGSTLVSVYMASTFYHSFQHPKVKHWLRILDHIAIYLLIAGTYTPFLLLNMRGVWGWSLFAVVWGIAFGGILFNLLHTQRFHWFSVVLYVAMGWICVFAIQPTIELVGTPGIYWLLAGGLAYTFGVVFYAWSKLPFNHAVWHGFVMGGSACHYVAVLYYAVPVAAAAAA